MQAHETVIQKLIEGERQFRVPIYQRRFTWERRNFAQLWTDILDQYELLTPTAQHPKGRVHEPTHFLGSFVLSPLPIQATSLSRFTVVDGQQRLTTLLVAMCALRDRLLAFEPEAKDRFTNAYLVNEYEAYGSDHYYRLVPAPDDQASFFACIDRRRNDIRSDAVGDAYEFFYAGLTDAGADDNAVSIDRLRLAITTRLSIVDITTARGDNVYRIFESLNATGVGLSQSDLLRNYFFSLLPSRADQLYGAVWLPMERDLGVEHLENLARVDLARRGMVVREDEVYRTHQGRLRAVERDEDAVERQLRDFALRAAHYRHIVDPATEEDARVRERLEFFEAWNAQTAHPLVMYLYDKRQSGTLTSIDMAEILRNLESFLVRRLLCSVSSRSLRRIFLDLVSKLIRAADGESLLELVRADLSTTRKYWADDLELRDAMRTNKIYGFGGPGHVWLVLRRLEESYGNKEQVDFESAQLTVEHIMPKSFPDDWQQAVAAAGDDPFEVRELVHTIGNLTLSAYNSELSNHPFERKQTIYDSSKLDLNRSLAGVGEWGKEQILRRADELADQAIGTWPSPAPRIDDEPGVWGIVHSALAAIPDGRWTNFGALAGVAGTSGGWVGRHLAERRDLPNRHRVLYYGRPVLSFKWADEEDKRDPFEVLRHEGVRFGEDGRADPSQQLDAAALADLIGLDEDLESDGD